MQPQPYQQPYQQQPQQYPQQSYLPPQQGQPAPPPPYAPGTGYPQHAPPAYAPTPSYLAPPPEATQALLRKAKRDIVFGSIWLAFGLLITLFTLASYGPYFVVAFGPIGYGIYLIIKGSLTLHRHR